MAEDTQEQGTGDQPGVQVTAGNQAQTYTVDTSQETADEELIGGKFKSQDELLNAYKELEKKLGSGGGSEGDDTAPGEGDDTAPGEGDDTTEDEGGEYVYSEQLDGVLTEAGVDPADMASRFQENGELGDEDYSKLEKAGYPREMVDAYVRGLQQANTDTGPTEAEIAQQVADIKASVGGDEAFQRLQKYVATWPAQEVEAYNEAVQSGDAAKAKEAVQKAHESYKREFGTEGKLVGGKAAGETGFNSEAELMEAMADPRYKTSEAYRQEVTRKLRASPNVLRTR